MSSPNLKEMMTRLLAGSREITMPAAKTANGRVSVIVKEVLPLEGHLLVRYVIQNQSRRTYHASSPRVSRLVSPRANVSLHALGNSQVDAKASHLKCARRMALPVFGSHLQSEAVEPDQQITGMVEIEPVSSRGEPVVLELSFAPERKKPLIATLVL